MLRRVAQWVVRMLGEQGNDACNSAQMLDLHDPSVCIDPYETYAELRKGGEVQFLPRHGFWIALSHTAVRTAFAQPTLFSSAPSAPIDETLLAAAPPGHTAVRKAVARIFDGRMLANAESEAKRMAASLLKPSLDVVGEFGLPISRAVTSLVIGFEDGVEAWLSSRERELVDDPTPVRKLICHLDHVADRSNMFRVLHGSGLGALEEDQCRSLVRLMWLAGTITTERVITRCVLQCLVDPSLAQELRRKPEMRGAFIEEVLRLHPPEHLVPRQVTADTVLGGVRIPAGGQVQLCTAAANRDPHRYEQPDRLMLARGASDHFGFGHGVHSCLGGPLARRVIHASLSALLDASPSFEARRPLASIEWLTTLNTLTPRRLEIVLEAGQANG